MPTGCLELAHAGARDLPYGAVIVDEAQDMGPQAFRLLRHWWRVEKRSVHRR